MRFSLWFFGLWNSWRSNLWCIIVGKFQHSYFGTTINHQSTFSMNSRKKSFIFAISIMRIDNVNQQNSLTFFFIQQKYPFVKLTKLCQPKWSWFNELMECQQLFFRSMATQIKWPKPTRYSQRWLRFDNTCLGLLCAIDAHFEIFMESKWTLICGKPREKS